MKNVKLPGEVKEPPKPKTQAEERDDLITTVAKAAMEVLPLWRKKGLEATKSHYSSFKEKDLRKELRDLTYAERH